MQPHEPGPIIVFGTEYVVDRSPVSVEPPANQNDVQNWTWRPYDPSVISDSGRVNRATARAQAYGARTNYRPSDVRQEVVLLFNIGVLNPRFLHWLRYYNMKYFYISYQDMIHNGTVKVSIDDEAASFLTIGPASLNLQDVSAVVWNPPVLPWSLFDFSAQSEAPHAGFFAKRWGQLLRDLNGLVAPDCLWFPSHPLNGSQEWQNRVSEYALAKEAGLRVPPTLCTNEPEAALEFIRRHDGRVLFREFSWPPLSFPPVRLESQADLAIAEQLHSSPCTFQKYIEKEYEVRAVVIGDRVFACRIDSQASDLAKFDWHAYDNANVRWDRMDLPQQVEAAMLRLMKRLDLLWGSFDLIRGKDGHFYFLEVNRPGATYWLLPFVGLDVPKEISAHIAQRWGVGEKRQRRTSGLGDPVR